MEAELLGWQYIQLQQWSISKICGHNTNWPGCSIFDSGTCFHFKLRLTEVCLSAFSQGRLSFKCWVDISVVSAAFCWYVNFFYPKKKKKNRNCKETGSLKAAVRKLRCVNASPEWPFHQHCEIWFSSSFEKEFCLCFGWSRAFPTHAAGAVYKQFLFVHISSYPAVQIKLPITAYFSAGCFYS